MFELLYVYETGTGGGKKMTGAQADGSLFYQMLQQYAYSRTKLVVKCLLVLHLGKPQKEQYLD